MKKRALNMPKEACAELLNKLLADLVVLYVKLYNYHWNVKGPTFNELHALFASQYDELIGFIDTVAERIRALDGVAVGTLKEFLSLTSLQEGNSAQSWLEMVSEIANDFETLSNTMGELFRALTNYGDNGSADLMLTMQAFADKARWMLKAHLENGTVPTLNILDASSFMRGL